MIGGLFTGLGFGVAFWIVVIPCLILMSRKQDREKFDADMKDYWERSIASGERQAEMLKYIAETIELANKCR